MKRFFAIFGETKILSAGTGSFVLEPRFRSESNLSADAFVAQSLKGDDL